MSMMKVVEMVQNGRKGYYTGRWSRYNNGFRTTNKLENIPNSGRFFYESREWCIKNEGPELKATIKWIKEYGKEYKVTITGVKVVDVNFVPSHYHLKRSSLSHD